MLAYPERSQSTSMATIFLWMYSAWLLYFAYCIFWSLFILWDAVLSNTKKDDLMHQQLVCSVSLRASSERSTIAIGLFFLLLLFLPGWLRCWKGRHWEPKWQDRINFFIPSFLLAEPRTLEIWCVFSYYFCRKNDRKRSRFGGFNSRVLFFSFFWVFFFSTCQSNNIGPRCCKVLSEFLLLHNTKWPAAWPAAHLIKLSLEIYLHQSAAANPLWPDHLVLAAVLCIQRRLQSGQSLGKVASWISLQSLILVWEHWTDAVLLRINVFKQVLHNITFWCCIQFILAHLCEQLKSLQSVGFQVFTRLIGHSSPVKAETEHLIPSTVA